ncbi:MAG: hypothetical protein U0V56_10040 [Actinomycetota bacterium]
MSEVIDPQMTIGEGMVDSRSGLRSDVLNPATGDVYATVPEGDVRTTWTRR